MKESIKKIAFFAYLLISIGCSANSINYGFKADEIFGIVVGLLNLGIVGYIIYRYMRNIINK
jgi:hypothetical protein